MTNLPTTDKFMAQLRLAGGRYISIQAIKFKKERSWQIVVQSQKSNPNITVYRVFGDNSMHMAFRFQLKGKKFFLAVERKKDSGSEVKLQVLKLQSVPKAYKFDKTYLFTWEQDGDWGRLKSVEAPNKYVSVLDNVLVLDSQPENFKIQCSDSS